MSLFTEKCFRRGWMGCLAVTVAMATLALPDLARAAVSRVIGKVNDTNLVALVGDTHVLAQPRFDKGLVKADLALNRIQLVLKRSAAQEAALQKFMAEQQDPASLNFHRWLHADEFGVLYGPSNADITAVTGWLEYHGFSNIEVSAGRVTIEFDGTATQVQDAFHTEIHRYLINGAAHIANSSDPSIPAALAPIVSGIASLHDFRPKHQSVLGGFVSMNRVTHHATRLGGAPRAATRGNGGLVPNFNFSDPNNSDNRNEDIAPYDFAAIYNLKPLWTAGITGKGVAIAIAAQSDVTPSDVTTFRKFFGLTKFGGSLTTIHNGADPGIVRGDVTENTLDVEWAGASAPAADVVLVSSKGTATTTAAILSIEYIVDNEIAPIMSASYGECEFNLGKSGNAQLNALYQQGSAEGISLFESAGDQGSAGCDNSDATPPVAAGYGLQVNGFASSPYITGVGGTDFLWQEDSYNTYWGSNDSNNASALGYITELPWNASCASSFYLDYVYTDQTSSEQLCNNAINYDLYDILKVVGGSGGKSACLTSGGSANSCTGGYSKPSWQTGTGVPNDGVRDVPDVSLFASGGLSYYAGSAYLICVSSSSPDGSCDYSGDNITAQEVGGTSVSSPAMAGIMALVLQKTGTTQGLANTMLYKLAAKDNRSSCNSNSVKNGSSCIFYDVTTGNNSVPCTPDSLNCSVNTSGDQVGIMTGYTTTKGYDLATGLGSVNAYNLVNAWASSGTTSTLSINVSPSSEAFASTAVGATSAAKTVTLTNTGNSTLSFSSIALSGSQAANFTLSKTCASTLAAGASCTVSVTFKPTSAGAKSATVSITDNATGSPQSVALSGTATATSASVKLSTSTLAFGNAAAGSTTAAKTATVTNSGTSTVSFSSFALAGAQADDFTLSTTCGSTLAANASCTVSVSFVPVSTGAKSASVSIADNATGSPQVIALTGTGTTATAASIKLSASSLAFSNQATATTSAAKTVTLTNSGTSTLTLSSVALTGGQADDFSLSKTCGTTLAASASCTLSVKFTPVSTGAKAASVSITDNASGSPQTVSLTGTGIAASASSPAVKLSATSLAFAKQARGTTSAAQTVTLTNSGTSTLTFSAITVAGGQADDFILSKTCAATLAAGKSCALSVTFKPVSAGAKAASVSVADNASGSPQSIALTGTGS